MRNVLFSSLLSLPLVSLAVAVNSFFLSHLSFVSSLETTLAAWRNRIPLPLRQLFMTMRPTTTPTITMMQRASRALQIEQADWLALSLAFCTIDNSRKNKNDFRITCFLFSLSALAPVPQRLKDMIFCILFHHVSRPIIEQTQTKRRRKGKEKRKGKQCLNNCQRSMPKSFFSLLPATMKIFNLIRWSNDESFLCRLTFTKTTLVNGENERRWVICCIAHDGSFPLRCTSVFFASVGLQRVRSLFSFFSLSFFFFSFVLRPPSSWWLFVTNKTRLPENPRFVIIFQFYYFNQINSLANRFWRESFLPHRWLSLSSNLFPIPITTEHDQSRRSRQTETVRAKSIMIRNSI